MIIRSVYLKKYFSKHGKIKENLDIRNIILGKGKDKFDTIAEGKKF